MPKNNKIKVEADERKVLELLIKDPRQSPHKLAKKTRQSEVIQQ
jgi:hypothetical protein